MKFVLVVEDIKEIRESIRDAFLDMHDGLEVVMAENGKVALDKIRSGVVVDFMLLDLMMPVMDGWELLSVLNRENIFKKNIYIFSNATMHVTQWSQWSNLNIKRVVKKASGNILSMLYEIYDESCPKGADGKR